jgi:hypothetical protein
MMKHRRWLYGIIAGLILLVLLYSGLRLTWRVGEVSRTVTSQGQQLSGAIVRVKATDFETLTDGDGRFILTGFSPRFNVICPDFSHLSIQAVALSNSLFKEGPRIDTIVYIR